MATINPQLLSKKVQVVDQDNQTMPFVNILWGAGKGTTTNAQGQATVNAVTGEQLITFSFMGLQTINVKFKNITPTIQMMESVEALPPVLVTAQKKGTNWLTVASVAIGAVGLWFTINDASDLKEEIKAGKGLKSPRTITI